jgi:DNA-directed RNA polymerase subunit alpha
MDEVATLIRAGKLEQAEAQLQRENRPDTAGWHFQRGLLYEAQGRREQAIEAFEHAVDTDKDHLDATFRLAYNLDLFGDEDEAVQLYETLARRTPSYVNALLNLATLYEDHGDDERAIECVDRVLQEHPNHPRARLFQKDIESSMSMVYDENQERDREKRSAIMDTPISDFELSVRSRNCLKKMNINSLGDLLRISEPELLGYKNFGETSLNEIKAMLKQKGLRLGQLQEEATVRPAPPRRAPAPTGAPDLMNKPLSEIEFSGRSRKCLQRLNLVTLGDLASKTEPELLATKNFGQTSLTEIKAKLAEFGLGLRKKGD